MGNSFGQVIPVGPVQSFGFLGEVARQGAGDPFIISKEANINNAANINFGDTVVILPDTTGGTCKQYADWQANPAAGGGLALTCTKATSTTVTPASATLAGLSNGMLIAGTGIPAGTYISSVNYTAGTITISKAATDSATGLLYFAKFGGIAVREVKTQLGYPYTPPGSTEVGYYAPGNYVSILVRGGITVKCVVGTPVAEGPAYLRTILNGSVPAGVVGGIEANADGLNNVLLAGIPGIASAFFKNGAMDGNNLCELTLTNRVAA